MPVLSEHFDSAVRIVSEAKGLLRTLDALHIAVAKSLGVPVATFDTRMAEAVRSLGMNAVPEPENVSDD